MKRNAPHLYTLTGNLLAERTLKFDHWSPGRTQRANCEIFHTRGKGVNVSNMLTRLGASTTALIFSGGATGAESEAWLRDRGISYHAFPTTSATRTGTVIWSDAQLETTFLGPDVAPDAAAVQGCANYLDRQPAGCVLALCGSFPGWSGPVFDPLRACLERWLARGKIVVDAYGPPLAWLAYQPVDLIKINGTEFDALAPGGALPDRLQSIREAGPVRQWIVTQGPGPVWLVDYSGAPQKFTPPVQSEVSPTGSGDVLLACLLHAHYELDLPLADALRYAIPFAAANAAHPGVADFILPEVS